MNRLNQYSFLLFLLVLLPFSMFGQDTRQYKIFTVAFYNLENLFDTIDDPFTYDNDWTPEGKYHWTHAKYRLKLKNLAATIRDIGDEYLVPPPDIIGVCEVENQDVLMDLLSQAPLNQFDYSIVHFNSPDRRGIDVALLYRSKVFIPTEERSIRLLLYEGNDGTKRVFTRDILVVSGLLDGEKIHLIVNHWPSRRGGELSSRPKRIKASKKMKQMVDSLWTLDPYAKIICMGDFNDDPDSPSIKDILKPIRNRHNPKMKRLFNPMAKLHQKGFEPWPIETIGTCSTSLLFSSGTVKKRLFITSVLQGGYSKFD